ncbi:MAG: helix-turn-helix domain-containing protein [Pseudomonadota bacterium]
MEKLVTRGEAAKALRVSVRSIDRLRRRGELVGLVIGTRRLFTQDEIENLINRKLAEAGGEKDRE